MSGPTSKYEGTLGQIKKKADQALPASPQVRETASVPVQVEPEDPRERYTTRLPRSLVKAIKLHALQNDLNDYEVLEQAAREFLERHRD